MPEPHERPTPDAANRRRHAVSVVIPTLDEADRIGDRLDELDGLDGVAEVLVVDGGSADGTASIARGRGGARVLSSPRGRASQMNVGAAAATGDVLLFLHADVRVHPDTAAWIGRALADPGVVAGAFRTRTVADRGGHWVAPLLPLADVRSRLTRLPYGDQAVFVRRAAFRRVGGFPEIPILEDLELARRLRTIGRIVTVPATVEVSARRFLARPLHSVLVMNTLPFLYRWGVPPRTLAAWYGRRE